MRRNMFLTIAILSFLGATSAWGQDTDEVKRLKKEIELLQARLETANLKIEKLEAENRRLKEGVEEESSGRLTLSDRLPAGTTAAGEFMFPGVNGERGFAVLTITARDGNKVKGSYKPKGSMPAESYPGFEFEGTISGKSLDARSVGSAARKRLNVALKGNALDGTLINYDRRTTARVSFKLDK